jgi:hypothetical protein
MYSLKLRRGGVMDYAEIKAAAEKATHGPYEVDGDDDRDVWGRCGSVYIGHMEHADDAAFVASCDRDTVLEMLAEIERLTAERDAAVARRGDAIVWLTAERDMLRASLRLMVGHIEYEGQQGDGIREEAWDDYRAARSLVFGDTGECVERGLATLRAHAEKAVKR